MGVGAWLAHAGHLSAGALVGYLVLLMPLSRGIQNLSAAAPVRALAEAGAIALEVGEPRLFAVDVTAAKVGGAPASTAKIAFFQGALALARRRLFDTLRGTLTRYPLPSLDLSGLASDLPVDARLTPELRAVTTHGGRLQLGGRIR